MAGLALLATALLSLAPAPPKQLVIEHPAIHQFDDGPDLAPDFRFASGETVFFDFAIRNYFRREDDKVSLTWNAQVQDGSGIPVILPLFGKVTTELAPEDKDWAPKVRFEIPIPPHALSGTYKILISVADDPAKTNASRDFTFEVRGHAIEPADSLEVRNVGFYRTEEAPKPLAVPAYAPGDTVWIRFDIVGFKLAEQNRYDVGYGIEVLRPNGESMFAQPDAAVERGDSFYPRRYVPAGLSLNLQKDLRRGQYTVVITARDRVADQKAESRQTFSVE
jgi:hypothetical protein